MAIKRFIETRFWFDQLVLDIYSPADKLFSIYLRTNPHTSQLGIYALPKRTMSFELGYSTEKINSLLNRFQTQYHDIVYSETTQEVAVLGNLKYAIYKGGKPVLDLLKRELEDVEDAQLIQATYEAMQAYLTQSTRAVDHQILTLLEAELVRRGLKDSHQQDDEKPHGPNKEKDKAKEKDKEKDKDKEKEKEIYKDKDKERSSGRYPDHRAHDESVSDTEAKLMFNRRIVYTAYQLAFDDITPTIQHTLDVWIERVGYHQVQAAIKLARNHKATDPINYIVAVCRSWEQGAQ